MRDLGAWGEPSTGAILWNTYLVSICTDPEVDIGLEARLAVYCAHTSLLDVQLGAEPALS